jgi:hypothetical protein
MLSILLSAFVFQHMFTFEVTRCLFPLIDSRHQAWVGIATVFVAMFLRVYFQSQNKKKKQQKPNGVKVHAEASDSAEKA